jgi:CIC family chloride channel protein
MQTDYLNQKKRRLFYISGLACCLGVAAALIAKVLLLSIAFVTNLFYFQRLSLEDVAASDNHLGLIAVIVPVIGGLIVGVMAKYGSAAIRGHGIPEAMENILLKDSRIPKRITFLKPLSAAISIGSGGPFGAEGPIIATGGALGSLIGQIIHVTHYERKILLASGAAAGMTAIFGTPFSGVLLAIELLLFEFRPKSFIPVALAAATAATIRFVLVGQEPFIQMVDIQPPNLTSLPVYLFMGVLFGFLSVYVTKSVYWIEDTFEKLPVHWMWWPALGGIAVGIIGLISPQSLGVGYSNITSSLNGDFTTVFVLSLVFWKFLSWSIALGSGTSGGTLAPLLTLGSGLGLVIGKFSEQFFPRLAVDIHVAALVGMATLFAGCSHALLASVVFAFEITKQPMGLVPLLGSCSIAYLIASTAMPTSIMTEKIARRGVKVPNEYFPAPQDLTGISSIDPH